MIKRKPGKILPWPLEPCESFAITSIRSQLQKKNFTYNLHTRERRTCVLLSEQTQQTEKRPEFFPLLSVSASRSMTCASWTSQEVFRHCSITNGHRNNSPRHKGTGAGTMSQPLEPDECHSGLWRHQECHLERVASLGNTYALTRPGSPRGHCPRRLRVSSLAHTTLRHRLLGKSYSAAINAIRANIAREIFHSFLKSVMSSVVLCNKDSSKWEKSFVVAWKWSPREVWLRNDHLLNVKENA